MLLSYLRPRHQPRRDFIEERNYRYFLGLYARYIEPVADTYAYCLLRNHFHGLEIHLERIFFLTQPSAGPT